MDNDKLKSNQLYRQPNNRPPRQNGRPSSPPPNYTPEMPRSHGSRQQVGFNNCSAGGCSNNQFSLRRCVNRFTFIWTFNSGGFWFYPTFVGRQFVEGFRWKGNNWVYDRIFIRSILFHQCF